MNFSGGERYSVPFFINGNMERVIGTLRGCEGGGEEGEEGGKGEGMNRFC